MECAVDCVRIHIDHTVSTLRRAGAQDVDTYELKLRQNSGNPAQVRNHLSEALAALMFLGQGARVMMRESPDLRVEWCNELFYAEVKHFNKKEQDKRDEVALRNARGVLIPVGDTGLIEGRHAYQQISDVARKKKAQYVDGAINVLVIETSSDAVGPIGLVDVMAESAAHEYDDQLYETPSDLALRRLNGIILVSPASSEWNTPSVGFAATRYPSTQMSDELHKALMSIESLAGRVAPLSDPVRVRS